MPTCNRCGAWIGSETALVMHQKACLDGKTKLCRDCGNVFPLDQMMKDASLRDGHKSRCKACDTKRSRRSYRPDRDRARAKRYQQAHQPKKKRDPVKQAAYVALKAAVRRGELVRPEACEDCGNTEDRIDAHHSDYSKPLEVDWICTACHGKRHRMELT